jgi:hypothetical protein
MRAEDFIQDYFRGRTDLYRQASPFFASHSQRFFAPTYQLSDHEQSITDSEAERIISVRNLDRQTEVVTTGFTSGDWRMRYLLADVGDSWMITAIEMECGICHGSGRAKDGKSDCKLCKGIGWKLLGKTRAA